MVNVLLHRCCAAQIDPSRKPGRGAVMRPFVKESITRRVKKLIVMGTAKIFHKINCKIKTNLEDGLRLVLSSTQTQK